jgi:thiamine biosynthesis lipoprotein
MPPLRHKVNKSVPFILLLCLWTAVALSGCAARTENVFFNTDCCIEINSSGAAKKAKEIEKLLERLESLLSTSVADSDVAKVNAAPAGVPVHVGEDFALLYTRSLALHQAHPSFNPFIFPLVELWKFSPDTFTMHPESIPEEDAVASLLPLCKAENFSFDERTNTITKRNGGAKLDFGAIAKGYAADLAAQTAEKNYVVNIGGTLKTDRRISVAVTSPRGSGYAASFILDNGATATSGDYERYYIYNGTRYSHILDTSGYPAGLHADNPIISVTVVGAEAWLCDALSTLLFLEGAALRDETESLGYSALILTEDTYCIIGDVHFDILEPRQAI